ncbi:hypothetical protein Y1Q_0001223 [Alligator mississippiensis]|uniref:Uncharacterized protein n=1 Tax=Alligator mississippiensis TaxID=8496 RepID=A0A151PE76_ALLMI|nr:hypothetical protein Y1Q_0001223 [Alligator mississippiensis]
MVQSALRAWARTVECNDSFKATHLSSRSEIGLTAWGTPIRKNQWLTKQHSGICCISSNSGFFFASMTHHKEDKIQLNVKTEHRRPTSKFPDAIEDDDKNKIVFSGV